MMGSGSGGRAGHGVRRVLPLLLLRWPKTCRCRRRPRARRPDPLPLRRRLRRHPRNPPRRDSSRSRCLATRARSSQAANFDAKQRDARQGVELFVERADHGRELRAGRPRRPPRRRQLLDPKTRQGPLPVQSAEPDRHHRRRFLGRGPRPFASRRGFYPLSQTPLRYLLADHIDLLRDTYVISVSSDDTFVTVVIEETQSMTGTNRLMMMFDAKNTQLKQWTVTDPQGLVPPRSRSTIWTR